MTYFPTSWRISEGLTSPSMTSVQQTLDHENANVSVHFVPRQLYVLLMNTLMTTLDLRMGLVTNSHGMYNIVHVHSFYVKYCLVCKYDAYLCCPHSASVGCNTETKSISFHERWQPANSKHGTYYSYCTTNRLWSSVFTGKSMVKNCMLFSVVRYVVSRCDYSGVYVFKWSVYVS